MTEQQREWFTLEEIADALKVGLPTVQSLIDRGLLATQERHGQMVVSGSAFLNFLKENQRRLLHGEGQVPDDRSTFT